MATSKLFKKVPLTAPNRSGFNMSHNNFFSAPVGTLVPNLIDFLIPGDEIDLGSKSHVQLPPMATDFYGRIEYKEEAFFVPCRILFGGWKDFFVNPVDGTTNPSNIDGQLAKYLIGAKVEAFATTGLRQFIPALDTWNLTDNPTRSEAIVPDPSIDTLSQTMHSTLASTLEKYLEYAESHSVIVVRDSESIDVGAGSLLDYLGFKVSVGNSSDIDSLWNDNKYHIYDVYFNDYQTLIDSNLPDTLPEADVTYHFSHLTFGANELVANGFVSYDVANNKVITEISVTADNLSSSLDINNILPLMAYHKIYDDWYRAPQIQQSLFKRNVANSSTATSVANMPWITSGAEDKVFFTENQLNFANGHNLFELHQRNWQKDFFTSMTPEPQAGEASSVKFDIVDNTGEFTIASLRAANALQQWLDRNNIGGFRYGDMIYAQYGVYPSDAITDRAIYLGSSSTEVYNKSVYQHDGNGGENTNNPFNAIGSKYASPSGVGQGSFCNNYRVTEAGFVVKIGSLVPQAYYSTGVRRMFHYNDISDIAFPVLAGVGDQSVLARELIDIYTGEGDTNVLGYQQRYAEYKFIDDQVHGLLRDGQSLASFALQRSFSEAPQLGSEFLQIPRDYLDQVSATDYKLSEYGCWVNCYNDYRKSSTLPAYSIPTLEDMKGHTILVDKGGNYIA